VKCRYSPGFGGGADSVRTPRARQRSSSRT
jgi:hypothetical protein